MMQEPELGLEPRWSSWLNGRLAEHELCGALRGALPELRVHGRLRCLVHSPVHEGLPLSDACCPCFAAAHPLAFADRNSAHVGVLSLSMGPAPLTELHDPPPPSPPSSFHFRAPDGTVLHGKQIFTHRARKGKWRLKAFVDSGGMPSSHSSLCSVTPNPLPPLPIPFSCPPPPPPPPPPIPLPWGFLMSPGSCYLLPHPCPLPPPTSCLAGSPCLWFLSCPLPESRETCPSMSLPPAHPCAFTHSLYHGDYAAPECSPCLSPPVRCLYPAGSHHRRGPLPGVHLPALCRRDLLQCDCNV